MTLLTDTRSIVVHGPGSRWYARDLAANLIALGHATVFHEHLATGQPLPARDKRLIRLLVPWQWTEDRYDPSEWLLALTTSRPLIRTKTWAFGVYADGIGLCPEAMAMHLDRELRRR
jgi:hypothetical protein